MLLARHGESEANAAGRWAGQADYALTEVGRRQARELGKRLEGVPFRWIVSSSLRRATETAEQVLPMFGLESVETDGRLDERHSTAWTGLSDEAIEARWPGHLAAWRGGQRRDLPGENEPWTVFRDRVREVILELLDRTGPGLVIAHAGIFRAVEDITNAANVQVGNGAGRWLCKNAIGEVETLQELGLRS